jgi:hypothetical protein
MGTLQNNMFIPKGLDETNPPPHQEIVEHDVEWKDIRERLFVYDAGVDQSPVDWNLVYCLTQEQLEKQKLELRAVRSNPSVQTWKLGTDHI